MYSCAFDIIGFLKEWQTLAAGALALLGAWLTVCKIESQVSLSKKQEEDRIKSNLSAARCVLPLALSSIIEYCDQSARVLHAVYQQRQGEAIPLEARNVIFPEIPAEAIGSIQKLIESSRDEGIIQPLAKIVQKIQIQKSRLRSLTYNNADRVHQRQVVVSTLSIENHVVNFAIIYVYAESLLDYARFTSESQQSISWQEVIRALRLMEFYEATYPRLYELVQSRASRNRPVE